MPHSVLVIEGISPSPLPCPVALREVAQQYRGETEERQRRREGLKKKHIGFFCRTNPLARWALPLYRYAAQGERFESVASNILNSSIAVPRSFMEYFCFHYRRHLKLLPCVL